MTGTGPFAGRSALRRVDAVHVGHLDVGDHQVGLRRAALLDQLPAGLGHGDDLRGPAGQDRAEVVLHVGLVVGDGDAERSVHGSPRGKVMTISAPAGRRSPTAIRPPWASTIRRAMAMPRPVPLVLVV